MSRRPIFALPSWKTAILRSYLSKTCRRGPKSEISTKAGSNRLFRGSRQSLSILGSKRTRFSISLMFYRNMICPSGEHRRVASAARRWEKRKQKTWRARTKSRKNFRSRLRLKGRTKSKSSDHHAVHGHYELGMKSWCRLPRRKSTPRGHGSPVIYL